MKITALIFLLGLTALGVGFAWLSPRDPTPEVRAKVKGLLREPSGPEPRNPDLCPAVGREDRVYQVSIDTRYRFSMPDVGLDAGAPISGASRWMGHLHLKVASTESGPQWLLSFRDVDMLAGDRDRAEELARLREAVIVRFDPDCRIGAWAFPEHTEPGVQNEWKLLVSLMELVVPVDAGERNSWEVAQVDPTGEASVRYRWASAQSPGKSGRARRGLIRQKLGYRRLSLQVPGTRHEARIRKSEAVAYLHPHGGLEGIEGIEDVALAKVGESQPFAEARTVFSFGRLEGATVADLRSPERTIRSSGQGLAKVEAQHFDPYPGPLPGALSEAVELYERELAKEGLRAALGVLVPFLRAHPEQSEALLWMVREGSLSAEGQRLAFLALELAATPEARAALVAGLSDSSYSTEDRLRAAAALPDSGEVGTVVDALRRGTTDPDPEVASASLLGLGGAAGQPELDPEERRQIHNELAQSLALAPSPKDRVVAMEAMANAGDPAAAEAIEPYLDSDDPLERAAAVESLNRLGARPSTERTLALLERETDSSVQRAIAEGLAAGSATENPHAVERVAEKLLLGEPLSASVARPLVAFLGARVEQDPRAREALEAVLVAYRSREVRQMVGRYLHPSF